MLAFIKNKIAEKMPDVVNHTENDIPDSVVVECAHLIQELDALTIEGQEKPDFDNGCFGSYCGSCGFAFLSD